jgi:hypothetical protein
MKFTKTGLQYRGYINEKTKNTIHREEYGIAFQTNKNRGYYYSQETLLNLYNENNYDANGASKMTYLHSAENGFNFHYIVIKRMRKDFYPASMLRGDNPNNNQCAEELKMFLTLEKENSIYFDLLNPILRYDTVKSDHNNSEGKKALEKTLLVCLKAFDIGDWEDACRSAEDLNRANGLKGESYISRYAKGKEFANTFNLADIVYNTGNSGVIYDAVNNCYKAVFIDYAR